MNITLAYPPSANRYWRVWRGRAVKSDEARAYQANVQLQLRGMRPVTGPVRVHLDVVRPAKRGDLDNCIKVLLDALKGRAYLDDSQVVQIVARRFDDKARPRVDVTVEEVAR